MKRAQIEKEINDAFDMIQRGHSKIGQIQLLTNKVEQWIAEAKLTQEEKLKIKK